jgi:hypothetical protein
MPKKKSKKVKKMERCWWKADVMHMKKVKE